MSYDGLHIYLVVAAHTNKLKRLKQFLIKSVGSLPPGDTAAMASARSNKRSVKSGGSASSLHSDDKMGVASAEETARERGRASGGATNFKSELKREERTPSFPSFLLSCQRVGGTQPMIGENTAASYR